MHAIVQIGSQAAVAAAAEDAASVVAMQGCGHAHASKFGVFAHMRLHRPN